MATTTRTERRILGGALFRIRESRKMKQDTLAQGAGIHPAYLSNIERGKKQPSVECMAALANFLGIDLDDISYLTSLVVIDSADEDAA